MIRLNEQVLRISSERFFYHKFWLVILLVLIPLLLSQEVSAFQYENYEWGMSKQKAKNLIEENGYNVGASQTLKEDDREVLGYVDTLFNIEVSVTLLFTPKSKKLYAIGIKPNNQFENNETFYSSALNVLKERYGQQVRTSEFNIKNQHLWRDGETVIALHHQFKTILWYSHKKYKSIEEEETKQIHMEETKDKL